MSAQDFIGQVRDELSVLGLPLNQQPTQDTIICCRAWGWSVEQCVRYFKPMVARYEAHVNK